MTNGNKAFDIITDRILAALEQNVVPWRKPWSLKAGQRPQNAQGRAYSGINALVLGLAGYTDPRWLTFKKARELGGNVKRGSKSTPIVFWKFIERTKDDDGETETFPILKYYSVFNVEQTEGLELPPIDNEVTEFDPIEAAEKIIANMPNRPSMSHDGGDRAFYRPSTDEIHLPPRTAFDTAPEYYSTAFHELGHSTGHTSRLDRHGLETGIAPFGSEVYSREELAAEFASAFLCHESGITNTLENSAAYIQGWAKAIRNDKRLVVVAASQGEKAAAYILSGAEAEQGTASENTDAEPVPDLEWKPVYPIPNRQSKSEPVVTVSADYEGEHRGYHVRGYEAAFPTEGVTPQGVRYWKSNLIEMKRTAKADGLNYRRTTTRRRRKAA